MELKDYVRPLRKWWWLIVASVLVATMSSYLATRQQKSIYSTRATVMIGSAIEDPNPNGNEFWLTQQLANTYADIVKRDNVRQATMAALGLGWLPDYAARVVPNTQLVELTVTDTDPGRGQAVANELVHQLALISPSGSSRQDTQRQTFISAQLDEMEAKIKETQDEIARKEQELAGFFSARQIADAQSQIAGLQNKLNTLQSNYAALLSNTQQGALNTINVIEPAALPVRPVGPNRSASIFLAAAIGFALAAGAAYLLEYLDDTLKNPDDVQKTLHLTTLGAVPVMKTTADSELAVQMEGQSAGAEAYRVLRTNLQFAAVERPLGTLMITSPAPSEGKSLTAANLATAMAQASRRVVLVDSDLHRPRLHRIFGLRNNTGLTTALLAGSHDGLEGLLQETSVPGLHVLTSGPLPPNPAELLGSTRMRQLLADLLERADAVVLDSPPVTALSDAAILATQVDGVLMVLDAGGTRREAAARALEALRHVQARVVGALLNRMPVASSGYYYYYYYHYHYGYGQDPGSGNGNDGASRGNGNGRRRRSILGRKDPSRPSAG